MHFAFGVPSEPKIAQKLTPNYVLLDIRATLASIRDQRLPTKSEIFIASSARCYPENGYFVLNTRYYNGFASKAHKDK